jgi:hypothetical protein
MCHAQFALFTTKSADVNEVVPPKRAYYFSFARQAEAQLNKQGWKP